MLGSQPLHILNDGYLIIIKDKTKKPRELTSEEIKNLGVIVTKHQKNVKKEYKPVENSMKITIKM